MVATIGRVEVAGVDGSPVAFLVVLGEPACCLRGALGFFVVFLSVLCYSVYCGRNGEENLCTC